jgi:hypothetical protein
VNQLNPKDNSWRTGVWLALITVAGLVSFLLPQDTILAAPHTDLTRQFVAWRAFAFDSLRMGDMPLWNPYTYAGQPFLGGFQSGLLYPPNLIFLLLPLVRAINFSMLLHLAIAGWGMSRWASGRGLHPAAALLAGLALPLSGPVFPHVYAGHLSNLCTLAWAPWAIAGLEDWWWHKKPSGLLLASAAICMQILGGHMQYVFFFCIAAGLYAFVVSVVDRTARLRAIPSLAVCVAFGCALAAAQLLPGFAAAAEGVRSGKLDYAAAAVYALPPENLLTSIAPGLFGLTDTADPRYWGRCNFWETSVFAGVSGLIFAIIGFTDREHGRNTRRDLLMVLLLMVLALGRHLPVYRFVYEFVPGIGHFRGMSKFTFPAVLFFVLAIGAGIDAVIRGRAGLKGVGSGAIAAGVGIACGGLVLLLDTDRVRGVFEWIRAHPENRVPSSEFSAPDFGANAATQASRSFFQAGGVAFTVGVLLLAARRRGWIRWAAIGIVPVELAWFAAAQIETVPLSFTMPEELRTFVKENPGDYRVLNELRSNNGYLLGVPDIWGDDPLVLKRYAEFMTFTQNRNPDGAHQVLNFERVHPLFAMLRCRYVFTPVGAGADLTTITNPLPHALLISNYCVRTNRDSIFAEMARADFDPGRTVILEAQPSPRPEAGASAGTARVVESTADTLTLEADLPRPALLLVTDLYCRGWRVYSLAGSTQKSYEILPADYILRVVPLAAGRHRLRMEYMPAAFPWGIACSAVGWSLWLTGATLIVRRQ